MNIITEILRSQTVPGLTDVESIPNLTFRGWIAQKSYKVSNQIKSKEFTIDIYSHEQFLIPLAYDINRMSTSSFESISGIKPDEKLPKSIGWLIIRSYYSAYFAAQAILRIFGISCNQFDSNEANAITTVADLYSMKNGITASTGYYKCHYDYKNKKASCRQLSNTHQDVWRVFHELLEALATSITSSDFLKDDRDTAIQYLFQLREGLSYKNTLNNGSWLSKVRNEVNYSHSMGAWYPYNDAPNIHTQVFRIATEWNSPPTESLIKSNLDKTDHQLFISTCVSIISLCHGLISELAKTNSKVFLKNAAVRLVNQLNTP